MTMNQERQDFERAYGCVSDADVLHCEDDTKLGLAAGHAGVGFVDLGERKPFDHGSYAREFGKTQSVFGVGGDAGGPALNGFAAADHEHSGNLKRVATGADDKKLAARR